ncbi:hypothetical protein V1264_016103 [Littorina saxatilis]|uniref:Uncharacterized protein n=1 Tax=Littorina saxatilis TaxID=31220 RepID=A0AAN9BNM1_9CAEN
MAEATDGFPTQSEARGGVPRLVDMAGVDRDIFTSTDEPELEFDDDGTELSSAKEVELWDNSADDVGSDDTTGNYAQVFLPAAFHLCCVRHLLGAAQQLLVASFVSWLRKTGRWQTLMEFINISSMKRKPVFIN